MGRVGGDPQKRGNQEHPVVVFSVATHSNYNYQSGNWLQKICFAFWVNIEKSLVLTVLNFHVICLQGESFRKLIGIAYVYLSRIFVTQCTST